MQLALHRTQRCNTDELIASKKKIAKKKDILKRMHSEKNKKKMQKKQKAKRAIIEIGFSIFFAKVRVSVVCVN